MISHARKLIVLLLTCVSICVLVTCGEQQETVQEEVASRDVYLNHHDTARYVGMQTCKLCHQAVYNSFIQTGMGQSFSPATKQKSVASFDKRTVIYDAFQDFYYHPFWNADTFKILEYRLKGKDTVFKRLETVDYIIGSGQHTNSHLYASNGYLYQMPMTFFSQQKKWDFPPGFENGYNTHFNRKIGLECITCHNALPDFVKGSENKFNRLPSGIDCERCHGPGSIHVEQRSTGKKIDTSRYIDYSIVNPGKLSVERQFDVCQRCHLQGNAVLKKGKSFFDFRPGMVLSDYISVFLPKYKNEDDAFIMASHADRLKQSKCFIKSFNATKTATSLRPYKNALTCVTCHNPHISVKTTSKDVFNMACKNCHTSVSQVKCSADIKSRNKNEDNCVSCHMPGSGSIDIPHVSIHDHYIRKPLKKQQQERIKKFLGLYAINEKEPSDALKARAWLQQYDKFDYNPIFLDSAHFYLADNTLKAIQTNFEDLIHLYFIKQDHAKILGYVNQLGKESVLKKVLITKSWSNNDAWTSYRIGEAYYHMRELENAYLFYKNATELAPYNPEFQNKLGTLLISIKKIPAAIEIFQSVLKENPSNIQAITNLGYANLISGNQKLAEELYLLGLKINPDYEPLLMNLAGLKLFNKQYAEARSILLKILSKNPTNQQAKKIVKQLKTIP